MDALTEMHLLLREHGWEAEEVTENGQYWEWTREGCTTVIFTWYPEGSRRDDTHYDEYCPDRLWQEYDRAKRKRRPYKSRRQLHEEGWRPPKRHFTVAGLSRRLKQLAVRADA